MKYIQLYNHNFISLSKIGLGCVTFGREIDEETSFKILDYAFEKGINWFDTAEGYGGGNAQLYRKKNLNVDDIREKTSLMNSSEIILGKWIESRNCRKDLVICTKVSSGNSPENIKKAIQSSLERLKVDHVEIYKLHSPDNSVPISESLSALSEIISYGLAKVIGCSNFNFVQLNESLKVSKKFNYPSFDIAQNPFSLVATETKNKLIPFCNVNNIFVTSYSPLAAGFLTGKYTKNDPFPKGSRFDIIPGHADIYFNKDNFTIVDDLQKLSRSLKIPNYKLAMSWVLSDTSIDSVIIGARKLQHIDNAISAMNSPLNENIINLIEKWLNKKTS